MPLETDAADPLPAVETQFPIGGESSSWRPPFLRLLRSLSGHCLFGITLTAQRIDMALCAMRPSC